MAKTKAERLQEVHERALQGFNAVNSAQQEIRLECLESRRFVYLPGSQWEGNIGRQYENRPRYEINKIQNSVNRIFSEYRNNRISVDFRPEGEAADKLAETLDGLYRSDEYYSNAQEAYDAAFDEGVAGGMGAWRLRSRYEDEYSEDDEKQRICIEPVFDADSSVYFDIDAKRQDKADAKCCWVICSYARQAYLGNYGGDSFELEGYKIKRAGVSSMPMQNAKLNNFDWFTPDVIYVAEYYEVEEKAEKLHFFVLPATGEEIKVWDKDYDEQHDDLIAQGYDEARVKKVKRRKVHKYIMDGARMIEDCGYIAGTEIPVVPFYGKRLFVDNVERFQGHVTNAKDMQRLYNMLVSWLAEIAATGSTKKPIFAPEQMPPAIAQLWADDNLKRNPYLLAVPIKDAQGQIVQAGPSAYLEPPEVPSALAALIQLLGADMQQVLGGQEATEKVVSNVAHKALQLIQNNLDMQSFIYMDNMAKAMRRSGEIWYSMAKDLYVEEERKMRTISVDGQEDFVELNRPIQGKNDEVSFENDLTEGKYGVWVDVGPSYANRRDSTIQALVQMLQFAGGDAETSNAIIGMIIKNLDGEGISELQDWVRRRLVQGGIVKPTEEEAQEMAQQQQNQQPDPNSAFLLASAEKERQLAQKAEADTQVSRANVDKIISETIKNFSAVQDQRYDRILAALTQFEQANQPQAQAAEIPAQNPVDATQLQ
jgi:hypothetical protein